MSLNILLLSHKFFPDIGGIEIHSEILANYFYRAGHQVRVITWTPSTEEKMFPFEIVRSPSPVQLLKEHKWATVVLENNPSTRLAWPQLFFKRPLVIALHTWITRTNGRVSWIDRLKVKRLEKATKVISCSNALRSRSWPNAVVIENPYREHLFVNLKDVARSCDFVFLGRLVSDKGADMAIRAIAALKSSLQLDQDIKERLSLTIVGDGPERKNLESLVKDSGLENSVIFKGALRGEMLVQCLNEHRFLVVPSVWEEPFGIVALEGMACGCVPIVSDGGGLPEAIGSAGLVFERGNVWSLICVMQRALQEPELENSHRTAASEHLMNHEQAKIAQRYLELLEKAVLNKN